MSVFHREGKTYILDAITGDLQYRMYLMAPRPPLDDNATLDDFTKVTLPGGQKGPWKFVASVLNVDGNAVTAGPIQQFTIPSGSASIEVGGYYVVEYVSGELLYFERWPYTYVASSDSPSLAIKPNLMLSQCYPEYVLKT